MSGKSTRATSALAKAGVEFALHEYNLDPVVSAYGLGAAAALGIDPARVFKTLVVQLDGKKLAVAAIPAAAQLDLKAVAAALNSKKAAIAESTVAERATGYVVGGISPLGQRQYLPTVIDCSIQDTAGRRVWVSAGRRGLMVELNADALICLCQAETADICNEGAWEKLPEATLSRRIGHYST
jgi:Cys-tRNA(Pro)/Cys-tRNA(Cys) deacylase